MVSDRERSLHSGGINGTSRLILGIYEGCSDFDGAQVACVDDWSTFTYEETILTVDVDDIDGIGSLSAGKTNQKIGTCVSRLLKSKMLSRQYH